MNAAARVRDAAPSPGQVLNLIQHRLEHALRQRVRYRYVQPQVLHEGTHYRIQSPCCSRNVDKQGGLIDIALLVPPGESSPVEPPAPAADSALNAAADVLAPPGDWRLYHRNHQAAVWALHQSCARLQTLIDTVCLDAQRVFWP